jgi:hypothetical protein
VLRQDDKALPQLNLLIQALSPNYESCLILPHQMKYLNQDQFKLQFVTLSKRSSLSEDCPIVSLCEPQQVNTLVNFIYN